MSLGTAYIEAKADAKGFRKDLIESLKPIMASFPAQKVPITTKLAPKFASDLKASVAEAARLARVEVPVSPRLAPRFKSDLQAKVTAAATASKVTVPVVASVKGFRAQLNRDLRAEIGARDPVAILFRADTSKIRAQLVKEIRKIVREVNPILPPIVLRADVSRIQLNAARAETERLKQELLAANIAARAFATEQARLAAAARVAGAAINEEATALARLSAVAKTVGGGVAGALGKVASGFRSIATVGAIATSIFTTIGLAVSSFGIKAAADLESFSASFEGIFGGRQLQAAATKAGVTAGEAFRESFGKEAFDKGREEGKQFLADLQQFAKVTPFEFKDVAPAANRLLAGLKLSGEDTIKVLTDVGNAVALANGGGAELDRVTLALSQIASIGKITQDNLNQVANAIGGVFNKGDFAVQVAALREGVDASKVSTEGLAKAQKDLQNGGIGAREGIEALVASLREAPGALGAMERQSLTLKGVLSNFKDTAQIAFSQGFTSAIEPIKNLLDALAPLDGSFGALTNAIAQLADPFAKLVTAVTPLIESVLPALAGAIGAVFLQLGDIGAAAAQPLSDFLLTFATLVGQIGPILAILLPVVVQVFDAIAKGIIAAGPALQDAAKQIAEQLIPVLPQLTEAITTLAIAFAQILVALLPLLPALVQLIAAMTPTFAATLLLVAQALGQIANVLATVLNTEFGKFAASFLGFPAAALLVAAGLVKVFKAVGPLIKVFGVLKNVALAARFALISLYAANPFGAIALAVAAVVAIVVVLYRRFETVRTILNAVANFVTQDLVNAFQKFANLAAQVITLPIRKLLEAGTHLPFGLGGPFKKALGVIEGFADGANAAIDGIQKSINIDVTVSTGRDPNALGGLQGPVIPTDPAVLERLRQQKIADAAKKAADDAAAKAKKALSDARVDYSGITESLNSGADDVAKNAKDAADKFKKSIQNLLQQIDQDFKNTLINGSAKDIDKQLHQFRLDIEEAFREAGKKVPNGLIKALKQANVELKALAREREKIVDLLKKATDRAASAAGAARDFANITGESFLKSADVAAAAVTKLNISTLDIAGSFQVIGREVQKSATASGEAVKRTAQDFLDDLKARKNALAEFNRDIAKLIASGINKNIIDDIISAGPQAGAVAADALSNASQAQIDAINATQKAIDKQAKELGNQAANNLFGDAGKKLGVDITDGLINGLKDRKSEIVKEMTEIAEALIAAIRKTLKVASPSKVMHAIGRFAGQGLVGGLRAMRGNVAKSAAAVADAMTFDSVAPSFVAPKVSLPDLPELSSTIETNWDISRIPGLDKLQADARVQLEASRVQAPVMPPQSIGRNAGGGLDTAAIVKAIGSARASKEQVIHAPVTIHTTESAPAAQRAFSMMAR